MLPLSTSSGKPPHNIPDEMTPAEVAAWNQTRIKDLWRVFRIMSEFVEGFETLSEVGAAVTVFGSARTKPGEKYYELTRDVARQLVEHNFGVITGGGPGIMEAANRGAHEAGGTSVGLNIMLPFEQGANPYIDSDKLINFDFFFVRKVMLVKYAQALIVMPGGYGTLDELFESITLIQTRKATKYPVILMGSEFWQGLLDWIKGTMLAEGNISPGDLDLVTVTDDPVEAVETICAFYRNNPISPNF